jgi:hypothetical protein
VIEDSLIFKPNLMKADLGLWCLWEKMKRVLGCSEGRGTAFAELE